MSALDGMTIWIGDYLADTTHLTTAQHGAYLLLLFAMWRAPGGRLPNDEVKLARIAQLPVRNWRQIGPVVMDLLTVDGDWVTQKRLQWELESTTQRVEKKKRAGKAGGEAKALKQQEAALARASDVPEQEPGKSLQLGSGLGLGLKKESSSYAIEAGPFRITAEHLDRLKKESPDVPVETTIRSVASYSHVNSENAYPILYKRLGAEQRQANVNKASAVIEAKKNGTLTNGELAEIWIDGYGRQREWPKDFKGGPWEKKRPPSYGGMI